MAAVAPWFTPRRAAFASTLPPVGAPQLVSSSWPVGVSSWSSRTVKSLPVLLPTSNRFRPLLDLPTSDPPSELIKRAISVRVRFRDFDGGTAKGVRRALNDHGGCSMFLWNAAVKYIYSLPEGERSAAFNVDLLCKRFINEKLYAAKPLLLSPGEDLDAFAVRKRKRDAKDARVASLSIGSFTAQHSWLRSLDASVRQQVFRDLVKANKAGWAKIKAQKARHERVVQFKINRKQRSSVSAYTFCLPAQHIKAEHVQRPTLGPAVAGQPQPAQKPRTWTKLTLPAAFGGVIARGRAHRGAVMYLTQRAPLDASGKLLGDVRFTRDRLKRWHAVVQRIEVKPKPRRPLAERKSVFLDPGTRSGNTYYSPDTAETGAYLEGRGGIDALFSLAVKVDHLVSSCKPNAPERRARRHAARPARMVPAEAVKKEFVFEAKKSEFRLRARIRNLVDDAHKRMAKDLTSRFDTVVVPVFETQKMVRHPRNPDDPARVLRNKSARQLLTLAHYRFRNYLQHRCAADGAEFVLATEEYTTIGCPFCGTCCAKGAFETFLCPGCGYTAGRDEKAAFTLCVKYKN